MSEVSSADTRYKPASWLRLTDSAFTGNGILITTLHQQSHVHPACRYRGLAYGEPWPLDIGSPRDGWPISTGSMDWDYLSRAPGQGDTGMYSPDVTDRIEAAAEYARLCRQRGVRIRTLVCATPRRAPKMRPALFEALTTRGRFLGYDYAYTDCEYSAVYDELFFSVYPRLLGAATALNAAGLFDTVSDLERYARARSGLLAAWPAWQALEGRVKVTITPIEPNGDLIPFKLWQVRCADLLSLARGLERRARRAGARPSSSVTAWLEAGTAAEARRRLARYSELVATAREVQRAGADRELAGTLMRRARACGLPARGPEAHSERAPGNMGHIHVGPVDQIRVTERT